MNKVTIHYTPQNHDGIENTDDSMFRYVVETDEPFENRSNGEKFAGFGGKCVETGEYKRFRWDRVVSIIPQMTYSSEDRRWKRHA